MARLVQQLAPWRCLWRNGDAPHPTPATSSSS
jgi:hypothetical protein